MTTTPDVAVEPVTDGAPHCPFACLPPEAPLGDGCCVIAQMDQAPRPFGCTRPVGHVGVHAGCSREVHPWHTWEQRPGDVRATADQIVGALVSHQVRGRW